MSTVCKLNPKVREDRSMRAAMAQQAAQARDKIAAEYGIGSRLADQAHVVAQFLDRIHRSSRRTGGNKNAVFGQLARELHSVQLAGQS